jgi:hypothetical protein
MTSDVFTLNVGGKIFMTTMPTLNAYGENMLTQMINLDRTGVLSGMKDQHGTFIPLLMAASFSRFLTVRVSRKLFRRP